jgi:hypothetical protein
MINKMILLILSLVIYTFESEAQVPQTFVYQGQILQGGTTPLEAPSVIFTIKILSPGPEACVLYQEQHSVNMTSTNGVFSLGIGNGVRSGSNYEDTSNLQNVFSNTSAFSSLSTCVTGTSYTPASGATRKIRVSYFDGSSTVTLSQDHHLQATPFAWYANSLQGLTPTNFVQVNPVQNVTQSNLEAVFGGTNYTGLLSLIAGSSNLYMRKDSTGAHLPNFASTPPGVTAGSVWYDTAAHQMKFYDGSTAQTVGGAGVGTGTVTSVTAGSGLSGGSITTSGTIDVATDGITSTHILDGTVADVDLASGIDASKITTGTLPASVVPPDPTKLSLSGGTMVGTLDMGGQQLLATSHITMSPLSTVTIGKYTTAQETTLVASLTAVNAGAVWYNSDTTFMMYWDGAAAQVIPTAATAGGDITDVIAGSGLTGGAATGAATVSVATGGITSTHILDGTIATADLADVSVTDAKIDTMAASKLTGTVANANLPIGAATTQLFTIDQVPHCVSNQKLEMSNGPVYAWSCVADTDSGGDITAVTTTAPLLGGGSTGALALTIDYDNSSIGINGSSQLEVKDGGVTDAKVVDVSVDKITSGATKYFSYMPAGTECGNGEILKWNAASDRWECGTDSNAVTSVFSRTGVVTAQSGDYTATQITNTPAGNIAATTAQTAIDELDTEKVSKAGDTLTGNITLNAQSQVRFADSDSSNYVALQAPATVASNVIFTLPVDAGNSGEMLVTDGAGVLSWAPAAVGDITGVTAGSGLTGGGTSGSVTLAVDTGGITSTHILDGTIATGDIADGAVTDAKITDLNIAKITNGSGDYFIYQPNNTACNAGEVLKWNNSRWECGVDNDTGDITAVATTAPLAGGGTSGALTLSIGYDNSTIGMNGSSQLEIKDGGVTDAKVVGVSVDKITSGATKYFSYMPAGTECADSEVLKWNATSDRWECGADIDTQTITSVFSRTGVVTAQAGDYTATQITNTATGNIAAITAQAAINELDTEKVSKAGDTLTGHLTMNAQSQIRLADSDSSNYLALRAPATVASDVVFTLPVDAGNSGEMLVTDGAGVLSWAPAAVGDITGVTAGSGLTGGGTSGSVTLAVDTGGITSTHILDGTIATADIANSAITDAKISDVNVAKITNGSGNYFIYQPNNTACNAGEVLKWNNSRWECGVDNDTGDITAVTAGTGLTGGATSGAATLNIDIGTGASQLSTNDAVPHCTSTQKLEMSAGPVYAWTCATDNDAGGDITAVATTAPLAGGGTSGALSLTIAYDDSTIGINGSDQLEIKDAGVTNAKIVSMTVDKITSGATKYFSYMPAGTECADSEVLKWNATSDHWECGTDNNAITSVFSRTGVVTAQAGDYTATQITNTAAGNITAITAQAAINELDTEKVSKAGDTLTGNITLNAQSEVRLADSDSSNYLALRAPATVASNVIFTLPVDAGNSGEMLVTDGAGVLSWAAAAVGDITGVTAGSGLTGGGASGSVTLAVDTGGITSTHILDGTIATGDIANSAITDAKISDVNVAKITNGSGNYFIYQPNNTACNAGEVLKWNNSRWECGVDNDSGDITAVTAGTGLTGGATSGAATLNIDIGTGASQLSTNDAIPHCTSTQKLEMSAGPVYAWTCATDNDAGGDITAVATTAPLAGGGTSGALTLTIGYDDTTIGMNGSSQLEVKDAGVTNAKIVSMTVDKITSGATKYFSYMPAGTECADSEVLKWNATSDRWECGTDIDTDTQTITSVFSRTGAVTAQAGDYTATQITNTAAGNIVATTAQTAINELDTEKVSKAGDTLTGNITLNAQSEVRLADSDSSNYLALRAPATVASNVTFTLPVDGGNSGEMLITNGSGVLSWAPAAVGDITAVATTAPLAGGGTSGALTLSIGYDNSTVGMNGSSQLEVKDGGITDAKVVDVSVDKITSGATKYFSYMPAGTECGSGEVLKWNAVSDRWECGTDNNAITSVFSRTGVVTAQAGDYTATQITNTPAGNIAATTAQAAINELDTEKVSKAGDTLTGNITLNAQSEVRLADSDSSNYLALRAPATVASNVIFTLPVDAGNSGEMLVTDGAGVLSWAPAAVGDITAVATTAPLAGGGTSGALTLTIGYDDATIGMNGSSQLEVKDAGVTNTKIVSMTVDKITSGATKYFSYMPAGTECGNDEVLKWNAASDRWECGTDNNAITSVFSRTGVVTAQAGDYTATQITNTAAGNIAATTAQAALNELDTEKVSKAGDTLTGNITLNAQSEVRLADSDSSNYLALRAPATVASNVTFTLPVDAGNSGEMLITNGSGVLSWAAAAVGDITGVTAGSGLTGGGTSGALSIAVDTDGITSTHILDGTVATADIANSAITDAKISDVNVAKITNGSGNYFIYQPNNTACNAGEVLKWNNSRWECGVDNDSGDITAVTAGTGLTGGATSGAATLNIDIGTGASQLSTNDAVPHCTSTQKLEMSAGPVYAWTCATDNDAGGDITAVATTAPLAGGGTSGALTLTIGYDNSTIGMNGSSQLEVKDAGVTDAKIVSMTVDKITSGATKYFSYMPAGTECGNGEVLKWNATSDRWECGTDTDTDTQTITSVFSRTGAVTAQAGDYTATQITNTAAGNIAATTTQAALNELDTEKVSKAGDTLTGNITINAQGEVRLADSDSSNYLALRAPATVASNVTFTLPVDAGNSGEILVTDGAGVLSWAAAAVGDITGVTAGSGLTGGGASGSVSLAVDTGGITSTHILDGTIATGDIANSAITDAKIADVGVDKITSAATKYFSYMPAGTECANGETLKWNASSDRWTCGTDNDSGDITGVTAGVGLTGGGTSGTPTLDVDIGTAGSQLSTNDDIPHCLSTQKLEMSAGPVYTWSCVTDVNSGGDITAVNTTAPLSGGATTGAITLTIAYDNSSIGINGSSQMQVLDDGISTAKIADGAVTDAKIASLSVAKITSGIGEYFTYLPNNSACSNNQVLKWNSVSTRWQCGTDNDTGDITSVSAGSGLTGGGTAGALSLSVDTGSGAAQFFNNSAVPHCSASEKIEMSAGPVYALSCVTDTVALVLQDADGNTKITVEASANEDQIRFNTAGNERMVIDSSGFVGMGTSPGAERLRVYGDVRLGTTTNTGCVKSADGGTITGSCSSDMRLKKNVQALPPISQKLAQIQPKFYQWRSEAYPQKDFGPQMELGLIAQEALKLLPELVEVDEEGLYRVKYHHIPFYLLQGFSEQYREVSSLKEKVNTLEKENEQLKQRLQNIEKMLKINQ